MSGKGEHPGDPGRRLRSHGYQEGPGFLFLATQGGRPPGSPARATLREVRRRMRAVRLAAERGLEAAGAAGYSRRSVFRWTGLYKAGGIAALLPNRAPDLRLKLLSLTGRAGSSSPFDSRRTGTRSELLPRWNAGRSTRSATATSMNSSSATAAAVAALLRRQGRGTNGASPTNSGTSTSKVRSSSGSPAGVTSRLGSSAWLTTTRAS